MTSFFSPIVFLIPMILYLIVLGIIFWLIMRLIRSNEKIAIQTKRIADALIDRNQIERENKEK